MTKTVRKTVNEVQRSNLIKPVGRTQKQREYITSILENVQTFVFGPSGTGKTFIAASMAAYLFLRGDIRKIVLTRPAVEVEEKHGFLPGDIKKKLAPWVIPITEIIEEAIGKAIFIQAINNGDIEVVPFAYMRGRTFQDAFVLLDEAQNTSEHQMKMFLTRIGENTRVVVNGDIQQQDIPSGSGLAMALDMIALHNIPAGIIEFSPNDIQRSGICKMWVQAFIERDKHHWNSHQVPAFLHHRDQPALAS